MMSIIMKTTIRPLENLLIQQNLNQKNRSRTMKHISYQRIAYSVTHSFLDEIMAKDYLYLEDKLNNIKFEELSLVDKIFVIMCVNY